MKIKLKSLLAGVLALAQASAIVAISATTITTTSAPAQAQLAPLNELFPVLTGVDLTTQQKITLVELASSVQTQFEKIITPDQRKQFQAALGQGKGFGEALAATNVTPDQQKQLQGVFLSVRTQLVTTFTPAQKQKILDNVKSLLQL